MNAKRHTLSTSAAWLTIIEAGAADAAPELAAALLLLSVAVLAVAAAVLLLLDVRLAVLLAVLELST